MPEEVELPGRRLAHGIMEDPLRCRTTMKMTADEIELDVEPLVGAAEGRHPPIRTAGSFTARSGATRGQDVGGDDPCRSRSR